MTPRRLLPALVGLAAVAACNCDTGPVTGTTAIFEVDPATLSYGTVCLNEAAELTTTLRNTGTGDLVINDSELIGQGFELVDELPSGIPGDTNVPIRIRFTATEGTQSNGQLRIETDAAENPNQTITLTAQGFTGERLKIIAECEPTVGTGYSDRCGALNFKDEAGKAVPAGTTRDRSVRIRNEGCAEAMVNAVYFEPGENDPSGGADLALFELVSDKPPFPLRGGEEKLVTVRFKAPLGQSVVPDVRLKIETNVPGATYDYSLFASSIAPALLCDPPTLTYFDAPQGVARPKAFTITNSGDDELQVDSITIVPENGTTDFTLDLSEPTPFVLEPATSIDHDAVYTSSGAGSDRAKVVVSAAGNTCEIALIGGAEPQLDVRWLDEVNAEQVPPIDFGTVSTLPANCQLPQVERVMRLHNLGRAALQISNINIPAVGTAGKGFKTTTPGPFTIDPGSFQDVVLTFDPDIAIPRNSVNLTMLTNDPVFASATPAGTASVTLMGANPSNFAPNMAIDISSGPAVRRTLEVDGARTTSEAGDVFTYQWEIALADPPGSTLRPEDPTAVKTRLISDGGPYPDVAGSPRVRLRVTDQCGLSATSTVLIPISG